MHAVYRLKEGPEDEVAVACAVARPLHHGHDHDDHDHDAQTEYEYVVPAATVTPAPTIPIGVPVAPPAMAAPAQPSMGMQFTWQPLKIAGMQGTQAK